MRYQLRFLLYAIAGAIGVNLFLPTGANAHIGAGDTLGFFSGIEHPIGGLDHILAMVAVGLLAARLGKRSLWLLPATFLGAMVCGSFLGRTGLDFPHIETGILASDFIFALIILGGWQLPPSLMAAIVGGFALFHGFAHGAEMPSTANGLAYGGGFLLATALLHGVGIAAGSTIARLSPKYRDRLFQAGGIALLVGASYTLWDKF
jgi:urease accessory protein